MVVILAILLAASVFFRRTFLLHRSRTRPAASAVSQVPPVSPLGEIGSHAPQLRLTDIHGRALPPEIVHGKVLLLDYWAPWCMPCEKEMPGYQELQDKYRDRGVVVIGVVFDPGMAMGEETAEHFAERLHIRYPLVNDSPELQRQFGGIQGVPTTYLVDRAGVIRYKVIGFESTDAVEKALQPLL
jgi:peroxiredoxin